MRHDFESAAWAEHHHQLSAAIAGIIHKVAYAFERLAAIEYDAPWQHERR